MDRILIIRDTIDPAPHPSEPITSTTLAAGGLTRLLVTGTGTGTGLRGARVATLGDAGCSYVQGMSDTIQSTLRVAQWYSKYPVLRTVYTE